MNWTRPKDLRAQLARLWERGDWLRAGLSDEANFPRRLTLKTPGSTDVTERFEAVRAWAVELAEIDWIRLEWREVRHRVQGTQRLPAAAWIDSLDQVLTALGKRRDWQRFMALTETTRQTNPALLPWLARRPLQALELADDWPRLLAVVGWVSAHPRSEIYLRQVDLPGVHTKFIEAHRGVLTELLDLALPGEQVDATKTGVGQFAARYGFREKPVRIRLRLLDPLLNSIPDLECPDLTLDAADFSRLRWPVRHVFITENETNFLAFPRLRDAMLLFGAGYGWESLAQAHWLRDCTIHYWGDIDTHGFVILDQLRAHLDSVRSLLMDRATLDAHRALWGVEDKPSRAELQRLTDEERALYQDLRLNRLGPNLRLEQEHVGFKWLVEHLRRLGVELLSQNGSLPPDWPTSRHSPAPLPW
ncbi:DUF3322 domain-containing protein [Allochromatium palmeri]|uniref:DUF3322 and DUF2220 domain-containing protein n=1 Tax=Allochromatium palmeri TaxID=231048 RepID=A0A6N8E7S8_9GAMM|nr:DUF3322 domain-containing protein [Allochromatium palmeri]MTW20342.1 hypothetical protein [Allochromatium palmeri]